MSRDNKRSVSYGKYVAWYPASGQGTAGTHIVHFYRHGLRTTAGVWHEVHPLIVELVPDGRGPMMLFVSCSERVRSLEDLVVGEWIGPVEVPP